MLTKISENANINKFHKSVQYIVSQCTVCQEAWPLKCKPRSPYVCTRCSRDKKYPKKFSTENLMIPSFVPNELQNLTQIEEMLIARALPIMKVYIKPGGQRGYSGHCINLPQNVTELATSLPRYPKDLAVIIVKVKGQDNTFKDVTVRKQKVHNALVWLINNNPHYSGLTINDNALNSLPENGVQPILGQSLGIAHIYLRMWMTFGIIGQAYIHLCLTNMHQCRKYA